MMAAIIFVKKSLSTHLPKLHRFALEYIFLLHNETKEFWSMVHVGVECLNLTVMEIL